MSKNSTGVNTIIVTIFVVVIFIISGFNGLMKKKIKFFEMTQ